MNTPYGSQSMVTPLRTVLLRRPDAAFGRANPARWHYTARPYLAKALREHDALAAIIRNESDAEVLYHETPLPDHADAIFVHDPILVTDQGAVLLRMGKSLRQGEPEAFEPTLEKIGIPLHYRLRGEALAEGGDLLWVDQDTLAVGQGFRTNAEGLRQLREALPQVKVMPVPLPYHHGPEACLHLMSLISLVDHDLAVIYPPLLPVPFYRFLSGRGYQFVEVPEAEFASMGTNVLALAPRRGLMLQGNPITKSRLEAAGCTVFTYQGDEISLKAEGGASCLTRPVYRAAES